jgi:cytochrome c oxidase assembly factor CtaG/polyferredoxin
MNRTLDAFLRSWPFDPGLLVALLLTAGCYLRGWLVLRRRAPARWHPAQPACFLAGLAALFLALASPIEPFAALLLLVHMVQHLLLMMVVPPLLWLGAPLLPLLRGLPMALRIYWVAPFLRMPFVRRVFQGLTNPMTAWFLFVASTLVWHVPSVYESALRSDGLHYLQHMCFLGTGLLFWYPVIQPYPSRSRGAGWFLLPYLILADVQNTVLSALLTFSDRVIYPHYAQVPRLGGLSPLDDQQAAGVLMWVPGSLAYLVPLFWIGLRLLYGESASVTDASQKRQTPAPTLLRNVANHSENGRVSLPLVTPPGYDLLRAPLLGRFLKWRHARLALQLPLLLLASLVIYDGFTGPAVSPMNLAGVLPWIHWRGLVILGMLAVGNVFCMACPFLLPRTLARRVLPQPSRGWPRLLRSKWIALALLVLFLWAYEALALWDSPWWTAWLAVGYFVAAFVVDVFFRGAPFCKYVCPIGQFNFVQSLVSPLEVKARDPAVCAACRTKDCIRGNGRIPGCELHLFVPRKAGNLDCTLCLDCVHACPYDNIGLRAVTPGADLSNDRQRSGIGRYGKRPDLAALVVVLVFGAFVNAAGMIGPVVAWQDQVASVFGTSSPLLPATVFYLLGIVVVPVFAVGSAAAGSQWWGGLQTGTWQTATRFAYALIPLGFGMWSAHYSFHFLTSYDAALPAAQRFAADHGSTLLGTPEWICSCCRPVGDWLLRLEIVFLDVGLLLSLYTAYRLALASSARMAQAVRVWAPWALLIVGLFGTGIWIVLQPMQMRGTMPG